LGIGTYTLPGFSTSTHQSRILKQTWVGDQLPEIIDVEMQSGLDTKSTTEIALTAVRKGEKPSIVTLRTKRSPMVGQSKKESFNEGASNVSMVPVFIPEKQDIELLIAITWKAARVAMVKEIETITGPKS
jgi:hypothetical protein